MSPVRRCFRIATLPATPLSHVPVGPGPEALRPRLAAGFALATRLVNPQSKTLAKCRPLRTSPNNDMGGAERRLGAAAEIAAEVHRHVTSIFTPTTAIMNEIADRTSLSGACALAYEPITIPGIDPSSRLMSRP